MSMRFQFTHPCGCDNIQEEVARILAVSIHAPVWVRLRGYRGKLDAKKFQFTHPCGCDHRPNKQKLTIERKGFNSRTRVGATCMEMGLPRYDEVSIHAPVWVRHPTGMNPRNNKPFQFTHPCGCDRLGDYAYILEAVSIHAPVWVRRHTRKSPASGKRFQFTHPCGCDLSRTEWLKLTNRFNSRTRVGATK